MQFGEFLHDAVFGALELEVVSPHAPVVVPGNIVEFTPSEDPAALEQTVGVQLVARLRRDSRHLKDPGLRSRAARALTFREKVRQHPLESVLVPRLPHVHGSMDTESISTALVVPCGYPFDPRENPYGEAPNGQLEASDIATGLALILSIACKARRTGHGQTYDTVRRITIARYSAKVPSNNNLEGLVRRTGLGTANSDARRIAPLRELYRPTDDTPQKVAAAALAWAMGNAPSRKLLGI